MFLFSGLRRRQFGSLCSHLENILLLNEGQTVKPTGRTLCSKNRHHPSKDDWFAFFPNQGPAKQPHSPINYRPACFPAVGLTLEVWHDLSSKWRDCVLGVGFKSNVNNSFGLSKPWTKLCSVSGRAQFISRCRYTWAFDKALMAVRSTPFSHDLNNLLAILEYFNDFQAHSAHGETTRLLLWNTFCELCVLEVAPSKDNCLK